MPSERRPSLANYRNINDINSRLKTCAEILQLNATNDDFTRAKTNERSPVANALRSCAWRKMHLKYNPPQEGGVRRKTRRNQKKRRSTRRR